MHKPCHCDIYSTGPALLERRSMQPTRSPLALPFPEIAADRRRDAAHCAGAIQGLGPLRPDLCRTGRRHGGRRVSSRKSACASSEVELGRETVKSGTRARADRQCGQLQRLYRLSRARGGGDRSWQQVAAAARLRSGRSVRFLHRRDRRPAAQGQGARRDRSRAERRAVRMGRRRDAIGTTDTFAKGAGRAR